MKMEVKNIIPTLVLLSLCYEEYKVVDDRLSQEDSHTSLPFFEEMLSNLLLFPCWFVLQCRY